MSNIISRFVSSTLASAAILSFIMLIIGAFKGIPIYQSLRSILGLWWFYLGFGIFVTIMKMFDKEFWTTRVRMGSPEDPGLSDRGYRPKNDERQMTKEQWKAKCHEERMKKLSAQPGTQQGTPSDANKTHR